MELKEEQLSNAPVDNEEELKEETTSAPDVEEEVEDEESETEPENEPTEDDYLDELVKLREERDNYKKGLLSVKKAIKEGKEEGADTSEIVKAELEKFKKELTKDTFDTLLTQISDNENEKELIKFHYENTIKPKGFDKQSITDDLELAKLLANKRKIEKENKELKISLKNRSGISNSGLGSSRSSVSLPDLKLSPLEQKLFERTNFTRGKNGLKPLTTREFLKK